MDRGTCPSCGAAVLWILTTTGARAPLDAEPVPGGTTVIRNGKAQVMSSRNHVEPAEGEPRYRSHFVTCARHLRR